MSSPSFSIVSHSITSPTAAGCGDESVGILDLDSRVLQLVYSTLSHHQTFTNSIAHILTSSSLASSSRFTKNLISFELSRATSQVQCLFREETIVSGVLREYASLVSQDYLRSVMRPLLELILDPTSPPSTSFLNNAVSSLSSISSELFCPPSSTPFNPSLATVTPSPSSSSMFSPVKKSKSLTAGEGSSSFPSSSSYDYDTTLLYTQVLLNSIFDSTERLPKALKLLCYHLYSLSSSWNPQAPCSSSSSSAWLSLDSQLNAIQHLVLSGFLFLRFYSPALLDPQYFLQVPNRNSKKFEEKQFEEKWNSMKKTLIPILKTTQKLANALSTAKLQEATSSSFWVTDSNSSLSVPPATTFDPLLDRLVMMNNSRFSKFFDCIINQGKSSMQEEGEEGREEPLRTSRGGNEGSKREEADILFYTLTAIRGLESSLLTVDRKLRRETSLESTRQREELRKVISTRPHLESLYAATSHSTPATGNSSGYSPPNSFTFTSASLPLVNRSGSSSSSSDLSEGGMEQEGSGSSTGSTGEEKTGEGQIGKTIFEKHIGKSSPGEIIPSSAPGGSLNSSRETLVKPLGYWSTLDVLKWAETSPLLREEVQVRLALNRTAVDGKGITNMELTHKALETTLGLTNFLERKKLKQAILELIASSSPSSSSSSPSY